MSLAALIRQMSEAGAPPEAIAIAVEAIESAQAGDAERRRKRAEQKAKERQARRATVARHDDDCRATNLLDKENPPHPLKKTQPLVSPSLRSGLVDEPVDAQPPSKKIERTESDQKLLDQITDVWNAWAIGHHCPQVKFLTDERARRCRSRLRDIANGEEPVPAFRKVLSKCETSFFIRGSPRGPLTFDHLMREGFLSKMLEGGYEFEGKNQWRR